MSEKPENSRINQGGSTKWKPGQSGNPAGKPKGTRHKATMLAERLLDGQAEELIQQCVQKALDGDSTAMRLCIERLVPPRKDRPVNLDLPQMECVEDSNGCYFIWSC